MTAEPFDRSRLRLQPLSARQHDLDRSSFLSLGDPPPPFDHSHLPAIAQRIAVARERGRPVVMMMGAHVVRAGVPFHLIDLMERGLITHLGMNGAGPIHDYELALIGATTESVARYIRTGEFGLWEETGRINDIVREGAARGLGYGEALGAAIAAGEFPHRDLSLLAAGHRLRVPITVHIGIGYDIIHQHPNCDAAALAESSYRDFLRLAATLTEMEGGVLLNFGSAVMGPEVYLKALSMARNVAQQEGEEICHFTTAVFDLLPLSDDYHVEAPKTDPRYYYRPWKTILVRTVSDGGESFYVQGEHRSTIPNLHRLLVGR